jgi:parvulin-like peptidyl-prolyl isomerase
MYRVFMSRVYYEKKIMPRIQVTASEMREYYDRNRAALFTSRGSAQFRLIKIDVKKAGGRDEAMKTITALRNRVTKAGEPFDAIARSVNDNALLLKTGGQVTVDRGAFAVKEVDDAVWATPDGQVTDVIAAGDALYIAQVQEKRTAHEADFDDEAVQQRIADDLRSRDFREMRAKVQEQLEKDAVVRSDPQMMNTAVEMAMQNYPRWAGK